MAARFGGVFFGEEEEKEREGAGSLGLVFFRVLSFFVQE